MYVLNCVLLYDVLNKNFQNHLNTRMKQSPIQDLKSFLGKIRSILYSLYRIQ